MNCYNTLGFFISLSAVTFASETIQLPVIQDNSIVMVEGEWHKNAGQQARLRVKGNQHIVALAFDTKSITGKRVNKATLVCTQGEQFISGITVSTIASLWDENRSTGLTCGIDGIVDWGYQGARFPALAGGNSFTLSENIDSELRDGQYFWDIPPDLVHAMATGVAFGLAIHEHDADYGRNPTIFSREQSGKQPYLLVEFSNLEDLLPNPPTELALIAIDGDSAQLTLRAPQEGFAYEVKIDGQPLGRHNIPLVSADSVQTIQIRDLPASFHQNGTHAISVVTLNRTGGRSEPAVIEHKLFRATEIATPQITIVPAHASPIAGVGVIPLTDKYDATGKPVGNLPVDYPTHNTLYDGQRVHLIAAAGEVIGFQMLLRGKGDASVNVSLAGPKMRVDLFQAVYVSANGRMVPDPLIPLPKKLPLSSDRDQVVIADIYVPFESSSGLRKGTITISDGRVIPFEIKVLPVALPRQATFFCEMNSYGLPDHVDEYYALQRIAYDHRVHVNTLHYSHHSAAPGARKSNLDMRLASGRRMDNKRYDNILPGAKEAYWDDFVEAFGPYLDGSLFRDGHRGPIAAPGFYLSFHESWPLNCRAFFNGNVDAYKAFTDQPTYATTYVEILKDFARLIKSKGWNEAGFQVYFNNKGSLGETTKAPWILDEPSSYWDYRALQYYGELTDKGRAAAPEVKIQYRIDISRPEYCRGQLQQRDDLWVVSSSAFHQYRRLVTDRMQEDRLKAWVYGTSNHVHETNRNLQAWALDVWKDGATGIVPWQTVNKTGSALTEADQLGIFIFDKDQAGAPVIRHSLRLKAYREAQQLIEYLNLLAKHNGWTPDQKRRFINQYVELNAEVNKVHEEDAGTTAYGKLSVTGIDSLRLAAVELLAPLNAIDSTR